MESLGRILSRITLPGPGPLQQREIQASVGRVLGESGSKQVRVGSIRRNRLTLEVRSAARVFEWEAFRKQELLQDLRNVPGLESLEEVKFRVGAWRDHGIG